MYYPSQRWRELLTQNFAPKGYVKITCWIAEAGQMLTFTNEDLLSFTHHQSGCLVSGALPKNYFEFSVDNSHGRWDPGRPAGMERYLSNRLKLLLYYGFEIDGKVEWLSVGSFVLSEWRTSNNGLEAFFTARDQLELLIDKPYTGTFDGTLYEIAEKALTEAKYPLNSGIRIYDELKNYRLDPGDIENDGKYSCAEILQKCANAACCIMRPWEGGILIQPHNLNDQGYVMYKHLAYSYPETKFSRPLKEVSVTYLGGKNVVWQFGGDGETQTVNNDFIKDKDQAAAVSKWVCDSLRTRKTISGEVRGDPRLEVFDVVKVEDKYGTVHGVSITDIKCVFTGSFHISYTGYIRGSGTAVMVHSGEVYSGEVA